MYEKIMVIILAILLVLGIFAVGYRTAEMKYEDVSIFTYAPDAIND